MPDDSKLTYRKDGNLSSAEGPDAMRLMRAAHIKSGISIHVRTQGRMQITRGWGIMRLLDAATELTGQKYKRNEGERAMRDLTVWIETMKSALPTETRE